MNKKFRLLAIVSKIFKAIAVLVFAIGVVSAVTVYLNADIAAFFAESVSPMLENSSRAVMALMTLFWAFIAALMWLTVSEGIMLGVAIEENTRETRDFLRKH